MQFRLIYEGPLRPSQRDPIDQQVNPLADHKHQIRRVFHTQLKHLWATDKFLSSHKMSKQLSRAQRPIADDAAYWGSEEEYVPMWEVLANQNRRFDYRFVPLVTDYASLLCSLDVLFLRRDNPGSVIQSGDIDNRLKTLIDALHMPVNTPELAGNETPRENEDPFYVLLEDDKQVSHLSVETDRLLDPPKADRNEDRHMAHVVITVTLRPYYVTMFNLSFS